MTDVSGRGVGMSAVEAEVLRLGGAIQIETERGRGTRVELSLPKIAVAAPAPEASRTAQARPAA